MSEPNYVQILSRRYESLEWRIQGNRYNTLVVFNGLVPPLAELNAWWIEVETEILAEQALDSRHTRFERTYNIRRQILIIMNAVLSGDHTVLQTMKDHLDSLP